MKKHSYGLFALAAAAFLWVAPAAVAQNAAPSTPVEVTEEKIEAFAVATLVLNELNQEYEARAAELETDAEREELMIETNMVMMGAVEQVDGISIEEYNAIAMAAREDAALAETINEALVESTR